MSITTRDYLSVSNPDKFKATQFTMTIDGGYEASVITYGAVITDLIVPDKDGKPVLDYKNNSKYPKSIL